MTSAAVHFPARWLAFWKTSSHRDPMISRRFCALGVIALQWVLSTSAETLWLAKPFSSEGFTRGIEGPACDRKGFVFCVGFGDPRNIARVTPDGRAERFVALPEGSAGNGIRFDRSGRMYVADYTAHKIHRIDPVTREVVQVVHEGRMNQPNDLAIAANGTLYASDPNWKDSTGQVWRIDTDGKAHREAEGMGTTNGIEVSPDGKRLYVNESIQRRIWVFDIRSDGSLEHRRLFKEFPDHGFDGMRCDVDGNLYATRHGKGTVVKLSPTAEILREIDVLGPNPSNLCFGGADGCTVYVTEAHEKRLVSFRVDRPGLEWSRWKSAR